MFKVDNNGADVNDIFLVSLLLTLNTFPTYFLCFYC